MNHSTKAIIGLLMLLAAKQGISAPIPVNHALNVNAALLSGNVK